MCRFRRKVYKGLFDHLGFLGWSNFWGTKFLGRFRCRAFQRCRVAGFMALKQGCDVALETLPVDMEAGEKTVLMKKTCNTLILCLGDRIVDEDQALMLLTSLPSSYENFVETLLYGRESLTMEDVLATLNSRELKKRTEGTRGGTSKRKCFICHSEGHLKRDYPMKKSSGFVKKGKHDQDSDSSNDEGSAYFGEALVVIRNDEMTELVIDSCGSYHMTHKRDLLYEFKVVDGGSVQLGDNKTCTIKGTGKVKIQLHDGSSFILEDVRYVPGLRKSLISLGTLEKEGYAVKMQMGRIKVIKGCRVIMNGIRKKNCVYTLEAKVIIFGVEKHEDSKLVGFKQLGSKQVGFKQLGHKKVRFKQLGPGVETRVHGVQVSSDDVAVAQRRLEDKQLVKNKHGLLGKGTGKGTPWSKGGGKKGNVAEKMKHYVPGSRFQHEKKMLSIDYCLSVTPKVAISSALIDAFLKEGSDKDYDQNLSMYENAAKIEKQMNAKLAWLVEKYNYRSQTHIGGSSSQTFKLCDVYLTEKELHQLHLDEESLKETLKEQARDEKEREEKIRQKQTEDEEFMLEFGRKFDSDDESD
ncbi:zinc finger, CCHC-type containing protein [Tanacetum coccineum]